MSKKQQGGSILLELYNKPILASKVDLALDEQKSYDFIIELCESYGLTISKSALTRYNAKRKEAIETGVPLIDLLDKRRKRGNILDLKGKEVDPGPGGKFDEVFDSIDNVYSDLVVLDTIIQKGFNGLQFIEAVDIPQVLRTIEVKSKITGNQMQGLSLVGLRELRLRALARDSALTEVLLRYVPEDKHSEVLEAMKEAEEQFYENLDLTEEDRKLTEALEKSGVML